MRQSGLRHALLPVFAVLSAMLWGVVEFVALQRASRRRTP
jgi:hypothetical protein